MAPEKFREFRETGPRAPSSRLDHSDGGLTLVIARKFSCSPCGIRTTVQYVKLSVIQN